MCCADASDSVGLASNAVLMLVIAAEALASVAITVLVIV